MSKPDAKRRYRWRRAHRPIRAGDAGRVLMFASAHNAIVTLPTVSVERVRELFGHTAIANAALGKLVPCSMCGKRAIDALCDDCWPL